MTDACGACRVFKLPLNVWWTPASSPAAAGKWWWSSSRRRWCWGSEGNAAAGLTETLRSPGRPPSAPAMRSSLPPLQSPREEKFNGHKGWRVGTLWGLRGSPHLITITERQQHFTLALASREASASAAMALWSWRGSLTSLISTRSTLIPQSSVASSRVDWGDRETSTSLWNIIQHVLFQVSKASIKICSC